MAEEKKRGRGRPPKVQQPQKKDHQYYGRYSHKSGLYTAPDGERFEMTFEEYLAMLKKQPGGVRRAYIIKKKYQERLAKEEAKAEAERIANLPPQMPEITVATSIKPHEAILTNPNRTNYLSKMLDQQL